MPGRVLHKTEEIIIMYMSSGMLVDCWFDHDVDAHVLEEWPSYRDQNRVATLVVVCLN